MTDSLRSTAGPFAPASEFDSLARDLRSASRRMWWLVMLEAVVAIAFGIVALLYTQDTLLGLIYVFGAFAIADGILRFWAGLLVGLHGRGWWVVEGILGVVAGIVAFRHPEAASLVLLLVIAMWALAMGGMDIYIGFELRRLGVPGWGWTAAGGVLSVLFGILLMLDPFSGVGAVVWVIGIYAIMLGISMIGTALTARRVARELGL